MRAPYAGNNSTNLLGTDRDVAAQASAEASDKDSKLGQPSAEDLDSVAAELAIKEATGTKDPEELAREIEFETVTIAALESILHEEDNLVSREEFDQFRAEFNTLRSRIDAFNTRSGHQI